MYGHVHSYLSDVFSCQLEVSHMTVTVGCTVGIFICLTFYFTLRQTASLSCEGAVSVSCSLENVTQEHDCVCRNTLPGNAANSTTWLNQSTVISVNFVDHLCMLIHVPCNTTSERASI